MSKTKVSKRQNQWLRKAAAITGATTLLLMGTVVPSAVAAVGDVPDPGPGVSTSTVSDPSASPRTEPLTDPPTELPTDGEPEQSAAQDERPTTGAITPTDPSTESPAPSSLSGGELDEGGQSGEELGEKSPSGEDLDNGPSGEESDHGLESGLQAEEFSNLDFGIMAVGVPSADPASNEAKLIIRAGGDRTGSGNTGQTVSPLEGVAYQFYRRTSPGITAGIDLGEAGKCTTDATGQCGIITSLPASEDNYFYAVAIEAPAGWWFPTTWSEGDNFRFQSGEITTGGNIASRTVTLPLAFNSTVLQPTWANVRDNNPASPRCGVDLAVVIDLSNSVTDSESLLAQYKAAANEFVDALTGTPSRIALHTFATNAPANGNSNVPLALTSTATAASASTIKARINGFTETPRSRHWRTGRPSSLWVLVRRPLLARPQTGWRSSPVPPRARTFSIPNLMDSRRRCAVLPRPTVVAR